MHTPPQMGEAPLIIGFSMDNAEHWIWTGLLFICTILLYMGMGETKGMNLAVGYAEE